MSLISAAVFRVPKRFIRWLYLKVSWSAVLNQESNDPGDEEGTTDVVQSDRSTYTFQFPAELLNSLPPVEKFVYFDRFLLNYTRCVIHRPTGFGKTRFLQQFADFCDISSPQKYFPIPPDIEAHYKNHLILTFDLSQFEVYSRGPGSFDEQECYHRFEDFVTGIVREWARKYRSMFELEMDIESLSLINLVSYLPLSTSKSTIMVVDAYDAPLEGAEPEDIQYIEAIIRQVLYSGVLANFGGCDDAVLACVLIMEAGLSHNPRMLTGYRRIEDYSTAEEFAGVLGFTADEIDVFIACLGVPSEKWAALKEDILKECEQRCFAKDSKGESVYNSREVGVKVLHSLASPSLTVY